ncbi:MAG: urea transporter [Ktedonobacteraceae bacterium]|nr:urea transporter [Ktedonobacteraceae bacterium]
MATLQRLSAPWERLAHENPLIGFLDMLLRGCGQVMFQNNPLTGLLFLVGIFVNSALLGLAGLIGLVVSTLTAMLLRADRSLIHAGLFGYNGILTGIGLAFFLRWNGMLVVYIIIAAIVSSVVMMALINLLSGLDMPALTAPFVLTTWLFLFAALLFSRLPPSELIRPELLNPTAAVQTDLRPLPAESTGAGLTALNLVEAFFRGIGEVFFQDNLLTGIIFLIAILVNSRISALFAVLGSAIGMFSALFLFGGNGYWVYHGLYGFNAVLCAIALGGLFYVLTWESALYTLVCALIGTVVMASISVLLSPLGMPALTAPFVLSAWLFLLPKAGFHILHPVSLSEVTTPEQIRHSFFEHAAGEGGTVQPAS